MRRSSQTQPIQALLDADEKPLGDQDQLDVEVHEDLPDSGKASRRRHRIRRRRAAATEPAMLAISAEEDGEGAPVTSGCDALTQSEAASFDADSLHEVARTRGLTRRSVFTAAAVGAGSVGLAGLLKTNPASAAITAFQYDIKDFGATGNGTTDDTASIQNAINAASSAGGGIVWVPPGTYRLRSPGLTLPVGVTLTGTQMPRDTAVGSWFYQNETTSFNWYAITMALNAAKPSLGSGAVLANVGFRQNQPTPGAGFTPLDYDHVIRVAENDCLIENVMLYNPKRGIFIMKDAARPVGRVTLNRVWGQPLYRGILVEHASDIIRINNCEFWPFWSGDQNVIAYTRANGHAIAMYGTQNPQITNFACYGYLYGLRLGDLNDTYGPVIKLAASNLDLDTCAYGLYIDGEGTSCNISDLAIFGGQPNSLTPYAATGVNVNVTTTSLFTDVQLSNVRITEHNGNSVRAQGPNVHVLIDNIYCENWDASLAGFPAIEAANSAHIVVGPTRFFTNGHNGSAPFMGSTSPGLVYFGNRTALSGTMQEPQ